MKQEGRPITSVHGAAGVVHSVSGRCGKTAGAPVPAHLSGEAAEEGGMAANPANDRGAEHRSGSAEEGVGGGGDARRVTLSPVHGPYAPSRRQGLTVHSKRR